MVLRYWYLLRSSWPRLLDLVYWPAVQMLMWGFLQLYISAERRLLRPRGRHLHRRGAAVGHPVSRPARLLDLVPRGDVVAQSRQPDDQPAAPGRVRDRADDHERRAARDRHRAGERCSPSRSSASTCSGLGFALAAFFVNLLLTSWAVGIFVSGLVLRNGLGAENLAWTIMFIFLPLTCVYYPVAVLPHWLQARRLAAAADLCVRGHAGAADRPRVPADLMLEALALNVVSVHGRCGRLSGAVEKRPAQRLADAERRVTSGLIQLIWLNFYLSFGA